MGYVYLIVPQIYAHKYKNNKNSDIVVKFGKTDECNPYERTKKYPKGYIVLLIINVENATFVEKKNKKGVSFIF